MNNKNRGLNTFSIAQSQDLKSERQRQASNKMVEMITNGLKKYKRNSAQTIYPSSNNYSAKRKSSTVLETIRETTPEQTKSILVSPADVEHTTSAAKNKEPFNMYKALNNRSRVNAFSHKNKSQ